MATMIGVAEAMLTAMTRIATASRTEGVGTTNTIIDKTRTMNIDYRINELISAEQAIDLFKRSTLGERRPVHRPDIFEGMLRNANLTITAWQGDRLVGISRTLSDFAYVAYLADLAVDAACQRQGIGRRLVEETRQRLPAECMIVLLAAPKANEYYAKLGFEHNPRAWVLPGAKA